jgi:hypothetical protein
MSSTKATLYTLLFAALIGWAAWHFKDKGPAPPTRPSAATCQRYLAAMRDVSDRRTFTDQEKATAWYCLVQGE